MAVAAKVVDVPVSEKMKTTSFHVVRYLLAKNDAILDENIVIPVKKSSNVRLSVMIAIPSTEIDEDEDPLETIRRMIIMIKCLITKLPSVKLSLWNLKIGEKNKFLVKLPEDVGVVEKYVYDYNRCFPPGNNLDCRLKIYITKRKHPLLKSKV